MKSIRVFLVAMIAILGLFLLNSCSNTTDNWQLSVLLPDSVDAESIDGRLLLLISSNDNREPMFQISDGPGTQLVFGMDVEGLKPGESFQFDCSSLGYPIRDLTEIPSGEYFVQVFLNIYETFNLSTGHTEPGVPDSIIWISIRRCSPEPVECIGKMAVEYE